MSVTRHPEDRICARPGCITRLCVHNPGPRCYSHTKKAAVSRVEMEQYAYQKLMAQLGQGERITA